MSRNLIALQNKFLGAGQTIYDQLSRLHEQQGFISDEDCRRLAQESRLPLQHVRATAKFYDELAHTRPATHVVKLCNGEACRAAGGDAKHAHLCRELGVPLGSTDAQGVRVEHVTCVGLCSQGPNAVVDGRPVSLAQERQIDRVALQVRGQSQQFPELSNPVYPPARGPCIVMRNFAKEVVKLPAALAAGVYSQLRRALAGIAPEQVVAEIKASKLRGRGGAGFPTGLKLETVAKAASADGRRFVVVNADEGDAGAYIDKELLERDPHTQIEGALLAAYACGARQIYFYVRHEYPRAQRILQEALTEAQAAGIVGENIFGSEFGCQAKIVKGQGAYICGEETSLLRSIEGVPAMVSFKPPFPAEKGLWDCPTAVNNVETLHNLPWILEHGGAAYAAIGRGHERSRGTKAISFNTRVRRPGMYEIEMGVTLREAIFDIAGGMADGQRFKAVQVGGPLGAIFPERLLDTQLDFEDMATKGGLLGHGSIVVYSQEDDLVQIARGLMAFTAVESCGKCFPCRIGSVRGTELFDQMIATGVTDQRLALLDDLCETMKFGSLCALGGMAPIPIQTMKAHFPEELERYRRQGAAASSAPAGRVQLTIRESQS